MGSVAVEPATPVEPVDIVQPQKEHAMISKPVVVEPACNEDAPPWKPAVSAPVELVTGLSQSLGCTEVGSQPSASLQEARLSLRRLMASAPALVVPAAEALTTASTVDLAAISAAAVDK